MSDCTPFAVEVFFDGDCPLCLREIRMLAWLDRHSRIKFTNIAAANFEASNVGLTQKMLMDQIHGRLATGQVITGVEVFRQLYKAVGFGWIVWLTRLPGISQLLNLGYRVFAKNRLKWTGRCIKDAQGICQITPPAPTNQRTHGLSATNQ